MVVLALLLAAPSLGAAFQAVRRSPSLRPLDVGRGSSFDMNGDDLRTMERAGELRTDYARDTAFPVVRVTEAAAPLAPRGFNDAAPMTRTTPLPPPLPRPQPVVVRQVVETAPSRPPPAAPPVRRVETQTGGGFWRNDPSQGAAGVKQKKPFMANSMRGGLRGSGVAREIHGGDLRTVPADSHMEAVEVRMSTRGVPMNANVELWRSPGHTPTRVEVFGMDGARNPFRAVVNVPRGTQNSVAMRNTGPTAFPINALVETTAPRRPVDGTGAGHRGAVTIQGGALMTFPFDRHVRSVTVDIACERGPITAQVSLMNGPGVDRQTMNVYAEDANAPSFSTIIDTPGHGSIIQVINTSPMTFPIQVTVRPYEHNSYPAY